MRLLWRYISACDNDEAIEHELHIRTPYPRSHVVSNRSRDALPCLIFSYESRGIETFFCSLKHM